MNRLRNTRCPRPHVEVFAAGEKVGSWGQIGDGEGQLLTPRGIVTDRAGLVYIVDDTGAGQGRIHIFAP